MSNKIVVSPSLSAAQHTRNRIVDQILANRFPLMQVHQAISKALHDSTNYMHDDTRQPWEAERRRLLSLPEPEWQAACADHNRQVQQAQVRHEHEKKAKAYKQEANRFYNQPAAKPDHDFWSKMEYWTFDEAIALLLDKNPKVLTPAAVKKDRAAETSQLLLPGQLPRSAFLDRYEQLYELARRSTVMNQARLSPIKVIQWAEGSGFIHPPSELELRVRLRDHAIRSSQVSTPSQVATAPASKAQQGDKTTAGQTKIWTAAKLAELAAHHAKHGTKETAEYFGISDSLVRRKLKDFARTETAPRPKAGKAKGPTSVFDLAKR